MKPLVFPLTMCAACLALAIANCFRPDWLNVFLFCVMALQMASMAHDRWLDVKRERAFAELTRGKR